MLQSIILRYISIEKPLNSGETSAKNTEHENGLSGEFQLWKLKMLI